ncbi:MAG: CRISPR-associated helicase Cas3' [Anaerolineae bacterium]
MELYPFQQEVAQRLLHGESVILQAPTGAGKTLAALLPFVNAWEHAREFSRKCIYSVPLRVLATQFQEEWSKLAAEAVYDPPIDVTIQTGARPDDQKLEGNLIFTTVDQTLSNVLNIPYALSLSQGNLNAGAVLSSYLVFDELHLFPREMLATTLHLLEMLTGITPFVVMTATLSGEIVDAVADRIGAVPIVLSAEEAAAIPSQRKTRRLHVVEERLTPEAVIAHHSTRSVAICNTVDRAQALFEGLHTQVDPATEVRLLHSRFLPRDREASENWLRREFGKRKEDHTVGSAILVATQVVEVGLDITSETLHTELAPAASVIQRAGRCARYQDEEGDVYVYALPLRQNGEPSYAPYLKEQRQICERTWNALKARSGEVCSFADELQIVNAAHGDADRRLLAQQRAQRHAIAHKIADTIERQERGAASELIRDVDSRTVIVHPDPPSLENPWACEGFGLYRGTLLGSYEPLINLQQALGETWALMTAEPELEAESSREPTQWKWRTIGSKADLAGALLVAVNPRLAAYSSKIGFRLGVQGDGTWASPHRERPSGRRWFAPYERETFEEHVTRMLQVYEHPFWDHAAGKQRLPLQQEIAYVSRHIEAQYGWEPGTLDRAARLVIALHDVGKLDVRWQTWAHRWQEALSKLRGQDLTLPPSYMAAHTDYNPRDPAERALSRKLNHLRPNHAVESAAAAMEQLCETCKALPLAKAALTAIARHHSAGASGRHGALQAHPLAAQTLEALFPHSNGIATSVPTGNLARRLVNPTRQDELLAYLILVRTLRLADQRSQERRS